MQLKSVERKKMVDDIKSKAAAYTAITTSFDISPDPHADELAGIHDSIKKANAVHYAGILCYTVKMHRADAGKMKRMCADPERKILSLDLQGLLPASLIHMARLACKLKRV